MAVINSMNANQVFALTGGNKAFMLKTAVVVVSPPAGTNMSADAAAAAAAMTAAAAQLTQDKYLREKIYGGIFAGALLLAFLGTR